MNRRRFFKALGILSAAAVVAPAVLAEITFSEELRPTDQLDTKTFRRAVRQLKEGAWTGGYLTVVSHKIQENFCECRKIVAYDPVRRTFYVTYPLPNQTMRPQFVHVCHGLPHSGLTREMKGRYSVKYMGG